MSETWCWKSSHITNAVRRCNYVCIVPRTQSQLTRSAIWIHFEIKAADRFCRSFGTPLMHWPSTLARRSASSLGETSSVASFDLEEDATSIADVAIAQLSKYSRLSSDTFPSDASAPTMGVPTEDLKIFSVRCLGKARPRMQGRCEFPASRASNVNTTSGEKQPWNVFFFKIVVL